jgi:hypothetical protein
LNEDSSYGYAIRPERSYSTGDSFYGIVQGLSSDQIFETMNSSGLTDQGFKLEKVSFFKKMKNILEFHKDNYLEISDIKKFYEDEEEESSLWDLAGFALFDIMIILVIIAFALIAIFLLLAFILIPVLILILSLVTTGRIWKMFRVRLIEIHPNENIDYNKIVNIIHFKGGAVSENWREKLTSPEIKSRDEEIRRNYVWVMKGITISCYSLIVAMVLSINEFIVTFLNSYTEIITWLIFTAVIAIGFAISILYTFKHDKIVKGMGMH